MSAWSFTKKSEKEGIKLLNGRDNSLLQDLEAADEMYKTGEMHRNNDILSRLLSHKVSW